MTQKYGQFCPIAKAAEILCERWTLLILRELLLGTTRFSDLQRTLARISPTLLTKRLNELHDAGLLVKREGHYRLTAAGRELQPIVMAVGEWGARWVRSRLPDEELDVELLMIDFQRRLQVDGLPDGTTVIQFVFEELTARSHWWILVDGPDKRELCVDPPGREVHVCLHSDLRTMTAIWAGDLTIGDAKREKRLRVTGEAPLVRNVSAWLGVGIFAGTPVAR